MRVAILISGRGSNLKALLEAKTGAEICLVASNRRGAAGLDYAKQAGVPYALIDTKLRDEFESRLEETLRRHEAELICLAGFMRLLSGRFLSQWGDRVLNIHPSLLPKYKGLNTHQRVIENKEKESGCTVHVVREEVDSGPIILQAAVTVFEADTESRLAQRILNVEHRCYPLALRLLIEREIGIDGDRVTLSSKARGEIADLIQWARREPF